jgi:DNA-directed RNA polymerase specialized sigma24 family protein
LSRLPPRGTPHGPNLFASAGQAVYNPAPSAGGANNLDDVGADTPTPDLAARLAEEFQRLLDNLASDELRRIAVWKPEAYTNAEIAERLDCATRSAERRLRLIRKILSGDGWLAGQFLA